MIHQLYYIVLKVNHNQVVVHTFASGFTDEKYCLDDITNFDVVNDRIELQNSNSNGVRPKDFKTVVVTIQGLYNWFVFQ